MNDSLNRSLISGHEGLRLVMYPDSRGFATIGRGFNLDAVNAPRICAQAQVLYSAIRMGHPITLAQADAIFQQQYSQVASQARVIFPAIDTRPDNVGAVICDMIFELGLGTVHPPRGFLGFHDTVAAFKTNDYAAAIAGIRSSNLATEVPSRVANNIALLEQVLAAAA
jgi:GH24 family phage-related lysozyme (muramidase)